MQFDLRFAFRKANCIIRMLLSELHILERKSTMLERIHFNEIFTVLASQLKIGVSIKHVNCAKYNIILLELHLCVVLLC